ncbi:hypothetical protein CYMTET_25025 [Cymbomonas tetramitiformis]|uniref:Protein kinase domain-containing protein n=1 Tax=Cymbomonas tetramitiformis TaxID=36881 RepID=A0AAE0KZM8_9CHLO|nr:hypothetical protein CYMTET_25025 [Cymbomonas tetramitiformis]
MNHYSLEHDNIIRFKELIVTHNSLAIVMEYARSEDLFSYVTKSYEKKLDEGLSRSLFKQLICGIDYMHNMGICHRDLKLENTLLSGNPLQIKICDFGYSKNAHFHSNPHSKVGTFAYIAPEILCTGAAYDAKAVDVWSLGAMLHVMLAGIFPFCDLMDPNNDQKQKKRVTDFWHGRCSYQPPQHLSEDCVDLLQKMLHASPTQRISLDQVKMHPWLSATGNSSISVLPSAPLFSKQPKEELEERLGQVTGHGIGLQHLDFVATTQPNSIDLGIASSFDSDGIGIEVGHSQEMQYMMSN